MIVADFASEYQIRLHRDLPTLWWVEFRDYVAGLLSADTRLSRALQPETEAPL